MKKLKIADLRVNDVVHLDYIDRDKVLSSISKVTAIAYEEDATFADIIGLNFREIDEDWTGGDEIVKIHRVLFNYTPKTELEIIQEEFPEYSL